MMNTEEPTDPKQQKKCEKFCDKSLKNPSVKFMIENMRRIGCPMGRDDFLCLQCNKALVGGFRQDGRVVLCSNQIASQSHANVTLVHEMIHAFDQCRAHIDWSNCEHHACSEVRAAALSGDCDWRREFARGNIFLANQFQKCVKRRAEISVKMNPNCPPHAATAAVEKVYKICYKDTAPFEKIP